MNEEFIGFYPRVRGTCGLGGEFEASFCGVLPAQAKIFRGTVGPAIR